MKKSFLIYLSILIFLCQNSFAQSSGTAEFSLTFKFAKNIPVEKLDLHYSYTNGNTFYKINYKVDTKKNRLTLFVKNHFIYGVTFPTIIFTYNEQLYDNNSEEKIEIKRQYYFITKKTEYYKEAYKIKYKFKNELPNIIVEAINKDQAKYNVKNIATLAWEGRNYHLSNRMVKIKKLTK
ncbi:hypothetical protein [Polaribacter porphyrae]|nr:hypothetical protein [Polaribacter porphyrae]